MNERFLWIGAVKFNTFQYLFKIYVHCPGISFGHKFVCLQMMKTTRYSSHIQN